MVKLDGFLDHYLAKLPTATGQWLRGFSHALNQGKTVAIGGRNGRNTPRYGCNMGDLGHRSSSGMGISSLGW